MKRKLKQQFKLLNITLNTIVKNQTLLYLKLEQLERCILQNTSPAECTVEPDPTLSPVEGGAEQSK